MSKEKEAEAATAALEAIFCWQYAERLKGSAQRRWQKIGDRAAAFAIKHAPKDVREEIKKALAK